MKWDWKSYLLFAALMAAIIGAAVFTVRGEDHYAAHALSVGDAPGIVCRDLFTNLRVEALLEQGELDLAIDILIARLDKPDCSLLTPGRNLEADEA